MSKFEKEMINNKKKLFKQIKKADLDGNLSCISDYDLDCRVMTIYIEAIIDNKRLDELEDLLRDFTCVIQVHRFVNAINIYFR